MSWYRINWLEMTHDRGDKKDARSLSLVSTVLTADLMSSKLLIVKQTIVKQTKK